MSDYITIPSTSSVDMLRFRLVFNGEPGDAVEWFEKLHADFQIKFGKKRGNVTRYPRSLRLGTYREMLAIGCGETSIVLGMGRNGKGTKEELREGMLEFNPAKCYPSEELGFLYTLLEREPRVKLCLVRWDFATDYPIKREQLSLMRDRRKYGSQIYHSFTEYLGQRNKGGFTKLYDKQAESGLAEPLTRLEITIDEESMNSRIVDNSGREMVPTKWWPRVVFRPDVKPGTDNEKLALVLLAWYRGEPLENILALLNPTSRKRIRAAITEECGLLVPPVEYEKCRKNALAWENFYGGTA